MKLFTLVADLTLDTAGFVMEVTKAKSEGKSLAEAIGADAESIKASFSDAFSFAAGDLLADAVREGLRALGFFTAESVEAASSMVEVKNVIDTLFGEDSDVIYRWAQNAKEAFGMSERDALEYVSKMAPVLDSLGFSSEESMMMAMDFIARAGDIASFRNMTFEQTFMKMMSGLRGETEAIEDLGVTVHVSSMVDWLGLEKETDFTKGMTQQEQWAARYKYIMEKTTSASGDFVKTQETYANQMRQLDSNIEQLKVHIGEGLLPAMTALVTWFNSFFDGSEDASAGLDAIKDSATDSIVSIETTTANALALVEALKNLESTGEGAASSETWNALLGQLRTTIPEIGRLIEDETGKITGGTAALEAYVEQWRSTSMELAQQKAVQDMYDEYATIQAEIAKLETEQTIADSLRTGAEQGQDELAEMFFQTMLSGMENMGASDEDIKAMKAFGSAGAENLMFRIARGGNANLILSALLEGGDLRKNKSFEQYFEAGGGTDELLSNMIALYQGYQQTIEKYNVDNSEEIAARQSLLATKEQEIAVLQQILTQLAANRQANIEVIVNNNIDGTEVSSVFEAQVQQSAADKALTSN